MKYAFLYEESILCLYVVIYKRESKTHKKLYKKRLNKNCKKRLTLKKNSDII